MFAFVLLSGNLGTYFFALIIALLHELGHMVVAKICGYSIHGIKFQSFGVGLVLQDKYIDNLHEIIICAAGPIVNVILIIIGIAFTISDFDIPQVFYVSNIYMLCINLVPVLPLDGGRILNAVLRSEIGELRSQKVIRIVSVVCVAMIMMLGVIFFIKSKSNISLFIVALFLLDNIQCQGDKMHNITSVFYSEAIYGHPKMFCVEGSTLVKDTLKFLSFDGAEVIFVLDTDGKIIGTITNKYILRLMSNRCSNHKLCDACKFDFMSGWEEI